MFRDYTNYEIFADGKIWSKYSKKFLKPQTKKDGYQIVGLYDNNGKQHWQYVHKIVYCAVNGLWDIPKEMQINHKSEEKQMNEISNLELVSAKQNINFGTRNERVAKALSKRVGAFKNNELVMVFPSAKEAGRNGYCQQAVCACCNGKRKTHKGYEWKYLDEEQ